MKLSALIGGKFTLKNPLQDFLSSLNAVISTNESIRMITGHVIYNPAYTYKFQLKTTLVNVLPRMVMLALSFISDYTVYQICVLYKHSYNQCLTTLASSYVMLIYSTRTFRFN